MLTNLDSKLLKVKRYSDILRSKLIVRQWSDSEYVWMSAEFWSFLRFELANETSLNTVRVENQIELSYTPNSWIRHDYLDLPLVKFLKGLISRYLLLQSMTSENVELLLCCTQRRSCNFLTFVKCVTFWENERDIFDSTLMIKRLLIHVLNFYLKLSLCKSTISFCSLQYVNF